jgi:hypothetical protein
MMSDIFEKIMERQLELQRLSFGIDPTELQSDERKQYVTAMAMALNVEVARRYRKSRGSRGQPRIALTVKRICSS